jgi:Response regulators consisting of a CheY-like receiver domain and a winged-helix DNA-binding domain
MIGRVLLYCVKILIADDDPRIRELIHDHLSCAGYLGNEAGDGSAASGPFVRRAGLIW